MNNNPALLRPFTTLLARGYEAAVRTRSLLYDRGVLPVKRLPCPVISVGNLTVGGAGKTPLAIHVGKLLCARGIVPALLTRGYGRSSRARMIIFAPAPGGRVSARYAGDEPALFQRSVSGAWLGVSADRFAAAQAILRRNRETVFLLDDGFQHRSLHRDLNILIVDQSRPLLSDHLIPLGRLREPITALRRAQAVVLNGTSPPGHAGHLEDFLLRSLPDTKVFHCRQEIACILDFDRWISAGSTDHGAVAARSVFLVAGIAHPHRFRQDVAALGLEIRGEMFFGDHAWLSPHDWKRSMAAARSRQADALLVTEKDAVKLSAQPAFPLLVAVQKTTVTEASEFETMIRHACEENREEH